jgi:hypothetical protein
MLAQFAGQTGLTGADLLRAAGGEPMLNRAGQPTGRLDPRSLMAQAQMMGFQNLGGVIGGAGVAARPGEGEDPLALMSDAVATGVQSGFREGRLDRFFAQFGSWIEQVRTQGIMLDAASGMQLVRGMAGMGPSFTGEAGARAAMTVQQAMGGIGRGRGTGQLMFLRAAEMAGGRHGERTFMGARVFAANNPATVMQNFLTDMRAMAGGQDVTPDQLATAMEPLFQEAGMQFSPQQLMDMAERVTTGGDLSDLVTRADPTGARQMETERRRRLRGVVETPRVEAQYAIRRADLGAERGIQRAAREVRNFEMALAETLVPAISSVIGTIGQAARQMEAGEWFEAARTLTTPLTGDPGSRPVLRPGTPEYQEAQERMRREGRELATRQILEDARRRGVPESELRRGQFDVDVGEITTQQLRERMRELTPGVGSPADRIVRAGAEIQAAGEELQSTPESDISQRAQ